MKIKDNAKKLSAAFSDIKNGEVLFYGGRYYIKAIYQGQMFAVSLESGIARQLDADTVLVLAPDATLLPEGV
jgi:hypothetical protein